MNNEPVIGKEIANFLEEVWSGKYWQEEQKPAQKTKYEQTRIPRNTSENSIRRSSTNTAQDTINDLNERDQKSSRPAR